MKIAVITGAGSGIGRDCALHLLAEGWRVFALDRSPQAIDDAGFEPSAAERFTPIVCDVSDARQVSDAFALIGKETAGIDALVCSAGILRPGLLAELDEADFDALFAVNTKGSWLCAKAAVPLLEHRAAPNEPARVVFVGSVSALRPKVNGGAYAASKVAISYLGRVMAAELASKHILVNVVAPATVVTPMTEALRGKPGYVLSGASPLGRVATPKDVTGVIGFLLSAGANYISGAVIPVDGAISAAFMPSTSG